VYTSLDEHTRRRWVAFLRNSPHEHPEQYPEFGNVTSEEGERALYVLGSEDDEIVCVALFILRSPLIFGRYFGEAVSFSGPVFNRREIFIRFLREIVTAPAFSNVGLIRVTPYWLGDPISSLIVDLRHSGWRSEFALSTDISTNNSKRCTALVDLTRSAEDVLASFSRSARREIRRAERQGVTAREAASITEADAFFSALNSVRSDRGLVPIRGLEYRSLYRYILSKNSLGTILLAISREGTVLAGLLILAGLRRAHTRYFTISESALHDLSNLRIAPFLWWAGMNWARQRGCQALDVEGYVPDLNSNHPMYGIYKYKSEFAPVPSLRINDHIYIRRTIIYAVYRIITLLGKIRSRLRRRLAARQA
jgi:hypothetical protein